ncbi:DUF6355 family natural product biosynthesis protein [Nonomuraea sp. NPDC050153]|uniref:DUF6355 family natural product biosynthesis protein n=1 Tax=Nonomuraea sp. NPDC050153 TaxID=3364359 RepID=UPI0037903874
MTGRVLKTLAAVAIAAGTLTIAGGPAQAATSSTAASPSLLACGYDPDATWAHYNHCDSRTSVVIRVEVVFGDDYDRCVRPGRTSLGPRSLGGLTPGVTYAYYVGRTC